MTSRTRKRLRDIFTIKTMEGRLKLLLLILGGLALTVLLVYSTIQVTVLPGYCSLCHEMKPEYVTWKASVHSDFQCFECHSTNGGYKDLAKNTINNFNTLYKHFSGTYLSPIAIKKDIDNKTCLKCHSMNRPVTPPEGLVFPHQRHVAQGFTCIQCHSNVAHGGINERGFTINTDFSKWTTGMGKAYMKQNFIILDMQACINCHTDKGKPTTCTTCHTGSINLPENHLKDNWKNGQHGAEALKNVKQCDQCHSYSNSYLVKPGPGDVAQYARNNEFCSKCHLTRPANHSVDWRQVHGSQAKAAKNGCLVCHEENRPGKNSDSVATTYCLKCHSQQQHGDIINSHPPFSLKGKKLDKSCLGCHPVNNCTSCHYIFTQKINTQKKGSG